MSSHQRLRAFVSDRLSAAAEDIFGYLQNIMVEYEGEISRQRKLLDAVLKPHIKLQRVGRWAGPEQALTANTGKNYCGCEARLSHILGVTLTQQHEENLLK